MNRIQRMTLALGLLSLCMGCDQGTKRLAEATLRAAPPRAFFGGVVRLLYTENVGAWGSLGEHWPEGLRLLFLTVLPTAVLLGLLVRLMRSRSASRVEAAAYSLIVGGGMGNVFDRVVYGHVVDFLYVGVGPIGTNVFNVADVAIVTGAALLVVQALRRRPQPAPALAERSPSAPPAA
jgi:signal peptidase II